MKTLKIFLVCFTLPLSALAESVMGKETKAISEAEPQVVILNNQQVDQQAIHDQQAKVSNQPVVRVMGTPISPSYSAELRKSRLDAETLTEQKIVEKLESSRLRDEQERLNKLFARTRSKTVVAGQAGLYAQAVPSVQHEEAVDIYAGFHGGQSSNLTSTMQNIHSYGSFGLSLGAIYETGVILEGALFYSNHADEDTNSYYLNNDQVYAFTNIHQLSAFLSVKYTPLATSRFKPYVGASMSYNHWIRANDYYNNNILCHGTECDKSNSIDLGANVGMDFQLSRKISIGFNMMINVYNIYNNYLESNSSNYSYGYYYYDNNIYHNIETPMEETNWLIASINAKLYF